eukprot:511273-Rhodomonas_salina.1
MSGACIMYASDCLPTCYAMSSIDLPSAAIYLHATRCPVLRICTVLRSWYYSGGILGTEHLSRGTAAIGRSPSNTPPARTGVAAAWSDPAHRYKP